jgi:hypothetical protein
LKKINLIYIASNGRSGSTLLDSILGASDNITTLGELQILPYELTNEAQPCGCGSRVVDCKFWKKVLENNKYIHNPLFTKFRSTKGSGKAVRPVELISYFLNLKRGGIAYKYSKLSYDLIDYINRKEFNFNDKGEQWFVDASKDPYRLSLMVESNLFNIKVIHIVKDPRSFVFSAVNRERWFKKNIKTIRMAVRYLVQNKIIEYIMPKAEDKSITIRYESLATSPRETLLLISNKLNISIDQDSIDDFRSVLQHGISGNHSRIEQKNIKLDTRWKLLFKKRYCVIVWFVTFILAKKYGYKY